MKQFTIFKKYLFSGKTLGAIFLCIYWLSLDIIEIINNDLFLIIDDYSLWIGLLIVLLFGINEHRHVLNILKANNNQRKKYILLLILFFAAILIAFIGSDFIHIATNNAVLSVIFKAVFLIVSVVFIVLIEATSETLHKQ